MKTAEEGEGGAEAVKIVFPKLWGWMLGDEDRQQDAAGWRQELRRTRRNLQEGRMGFSEGAQTIERLARWFVRNVVDIKPGKFAKNSSTMLNWMFGAKGNIEAQRLMDAVRHLRNHAAHEGTTTSQGVTRLIWLCIEVEAGLRMGAREMQTVGETMTTEVETAEPWMTIDDIRKRMLAGGYDAMPFVGKRAGEWWLVTANAIAGYLQEWEGEGNPEDPWTEGNLFSRSLRRATMEKPKLRARQARTVTEEEDIRDLQLKEGETVVVVAADNPERMRGVVTAHDLMISQFPKG